MPLLMAVSPLSGKAVPDFGIEPMLNKGTVFVEVVSKPSRDDLSVCTWCTTAVTAKMVVSAEGQGNVTFKDMGPATVNCRSKYTSAETPSSECLPPQRYNEALQFQVQVQQSAPEDKGSWTTYTCRTAVTE